MVPQETDNSVRLKIASLLGLLAKTQGFNPDCIVDDAINSLSNESTTASHCSQCTDCGSKKEIKQDSDWYNLNGTVNEVDFILIIILEMSVALQPLPPHTPLPHSLTSWLLYFLLLSMTSAVWSESHQVLAQLLETLLLIGSQLPDSPAVRPRLVQVACKVSGHQPVSD